MTLTRRSLLGVAVALVAAGCRPHRREAEAAHAGLSAPDRGAVSAAIESERELIAFYDAAIARLDAVAAIPLATARARHQAHLTALDRSTTSARPTASPTVTPIPPTTDAATLTPALTASASTLQSAAVHAESGPVAGLLASIAAEHAADAADALGRSS